MRNAFAEEITNLAEKHKNLVLIMADIGNHLFDKFRDKYPDRFFNSGISEAHMISMAAGLSSCGYLPVCYTITPFATTRCLEQIKVDICYHNMNIILVGTGSGFSYASLGATHHSFEDIAILKVLPNMNILCAGDSLEVRSSLQMMVENPSIYYLRIGKKNEPIINNKNPKIEKGKFNVIQKGNDVALLSFGNILPVSDKIYKNLTNDNISTELVSCISVKPLDETYLKQAFKKFKIIISIEEHSLIGGAGSSISEFIIDNDYMFKKDIKSYFYRFGIKDEFLHISCDQNFARQHFNLDSDYISSFIKNKLNVNRS